MYQGCYVEYDYLSVKEIKMLYGTWFYWENPNSPFFSLVNLPKN